MSKRDPRSDAGDWMKPKVEIVSELVDEREDAAARMDSLLRILLSDEHGVAEAEAA